MIFDTAISVAKNFYVSFEWMIDLRKKKYNAIDFIIARWFKTFQQTKEVMEISGN